MEITPGKDCGNLRVLIVDDEASQRSGLAAMVTAWGMTAETAADGNDALEALTHLRPT